MVLTSCIRVYTIMADQPQPSSPKRCNHAETRILSYQDIDYSGPLKPEISSLAAQLPCFSRVYGVRPLSLVLL
ncbi:uncharacterized protein UV8b_01069 [Ustilaginoidea virens]|uniref:Uncharacterized protein n=1 Tax=Ustilaginoidea virens TaxID=1159556 RepID=A0A8E5HK22_USTVR|nr:uncharacterized protein UV8b_01069 [Ustilaginoidea virens]QUC16828.1 hypothetical protein UV8b_01069 [Ustilaginoidea virens]